MLKRNAELTASPRTSVSLHVRENHQRHGRAVWWFDLLLVATLCATALVSGGRDEIGRLVFLLLSFLLAFTFLVLRWWQRATVWRWSGAEWLVCAGLVLLGAQLAPLPSAIVDGLSPQIRQTLPLWGNPDAPFSLPGWNRLSLVPHATRESLATYVAYAFLFFVVCQRIETRRDVKQILTLVAVAGAVVAVLAWLQFLSGTDRYMWWYHDAHRSPAGMMTGSFINRNHFAHYLLLTCPAVAYMLIGSQRQQTNLWRVVIFWLVLVVMLLALFLSLSRGALLSLVVGATVGLWCGACGQWLGKRAVIAALATGLVICASLAVYGFQPLAARLNSLLPQVHSQPVSQERWQLWGADLRAVRDFLVVGCGAGTHAAIYPRYLPQQFGVRFTHAENSYLQVTLETGIIGAALLSIGLGMAASWCVRTLRAARCQREVALAALGCAALTAGAAHNFVDFPWYVPACMAVNLVWLAVVCRCGQIWQWDAGENDSRQTLLVAPTFCVPLSRTAWAICIVFPLSAAVLFLPEALAAARASTYWNEYLRRSAAASNLILEDTREARQSVEEMVWLLEKTVHHAPQHEMAWLRLATLELRLFDQLQQDAENAMNVAQVRSAVYAGQFADAPQSRQWLERAFGKNLRHLRRTTLAAHRAIQLSPWSGEAYVFLAETAFLTSPDRRLRSELLRQAHLLRPYDGLVLFAVGLEHLEEGRFREAFDLWQSVYHNNGELQDKLTTHLAGKLPTAAFVEVFHPNAENLWTWLQACRRQGLSEEAQKAARALVARVRQEETQSQDKISGLVWWRLSEAYGLLHEVERSVEALERAVDAAPDEWTWRHTLARKLVQLGRWDEATEQLRYCLQRRPFDESLKAELAYGEKQRRMAGGASIPPRRSVSRQANTR